MNYTALINKVSEGALDLQVQNPGMTRAEAVAKSMQIHGVE